MMNPDLIEKLELLDHALSKFTLEGANLQTAVRTALAAAKSEPAPVAAAPEPDLTSVEIGDYFPSKKAFEACGFVFGERVSLPRGWSGVRTKNGADLFDAQGRRRGWLTDYLPGPDPADENGMPASATLLERFTVEAVREKNLVRYEARDAGKIVFSGTPVPHNNGILIGRAIELAWIWLWVRYPEMANDDMGWN